MTLFPPETSTAYGDYHSIVIVSSGAQLGYYATRAYVVPPGTVERQQRLLDEARAAWREEMRA